MSTHQRYSTRKPQEIGSNEDFTNVYINNIEGSVDEVILRDICETFGGRVVSLVIIRENGVSLGYGFCNFATHEEAVRAIENMNNLFIVNKKIAVSRATTKAERAKFLRSVHCPLDAPEKNPNVYVKNLDYSIEEETLRKYFRPFGPIINVRIMRDDIGNSKGFGFVSFSDYMDARKAVSAMDGVRIGRLAIHIDFYESKEGKAASAPATPSTGPAVPVLPRHIKLPLPSKKPSPLIVPSDPAVAVGSPALPPQMGAVGSPAIQELSNDNSSYHDIKDSQSNEKKSDEKKASKKKRRRQRKAKGKEKGASPTEQRAAPVVASSADPPIDPADCCYDDSEYNEDEENEKERKGTEFGSGSSGEWSESGLGEDELWPHSLQASLARSRAIIVHGLRYHYSEKDVRRFFYDIEGVEVRPLTNTRGFFSGEWLVGFQSVQDAEAALRICNDSGQLSAWSHRVWAEKTLMPFPASSPPTIHDLLRTGQGPWLSPSEPVGAPEIKGSFAIGTDSVWGDADDFDFSSIFDSVLQDERDGRDTANPQPLTGYDFSNFSLFSSSSPWFCDDETTL